MTNPLLENWAGEFQLPPFDLIKTEHYAPAFKAVFAKARANIDAVAVDPAEATFANTIDALERSRRSLDRVVDVFFNLAASNTNDEMEALQRDISPKYEAFHADTAMNEALFARISRISTVDLSSEQVRVLELYKRDFVKAGASLRPEARARLKEIIARLATLGTIFSQNILADEKSWEMVLGLDDLDGLPASLISAAKHAAADRGKDGYVISLSRSLVDPFLQFSQRRDLREIAFKAWVARGENGGDADNFDTIVEILKLREERAKLLGFNNFADFKLSYEMAKTPEAVRELLLEVWGAAKSAADRDARKLTELLREDGINGDLEPWDWRYYAGILRKREHDLDEAEVKPYLQLDNMIKAAFDVAERLFGLSFRPLDVPLYHADARAWEVRKGDRHLGVFIGDYFARPSKRSGAWMSDFRTQSKMDGDVRPIVVNVCNFAKAPEGDSNLLTFDDARTLFHEFGHALHSIMSDVTYNFVAGTNVARDFVELPSQLYEHWLSEPEVLAKHALHAETGQPMPQDLLDRLLAAENFDQGFTTVEYTASALVDLDFHTNPAPSDPMAAQAATLDALGMPSAITMRHAAPHFAHVFSGDGYSSGYYSYMWSEVMDEDAFAAFKEAGDPFDPETAARLAEHIYAAGGSKDEGEAYLAFRGSMPKVDTLIKGRGLG